MVLLTIIIPTYNRVSLIRYTLESLYKQAQDVAFEVIVVDDGSTDDTIAYISGNFPKVKVIKNVHKGAASARNMGLANATGKYILYLDSDDLVGEHFFAAKTKYLEDHIDTDACYGDYDFFSADGAFSPSAVVFKHKYPKLSDTSAHLTEYLRGNYLPPNSILWRKTSLHVIKGHNEELLINQDVDLVMQALFAGMKIVYVPDGSKAYIRHHNIDSRVGDANTSVKWEQILELRKKYLQHLNKTDDTEQAHYKSLSIFLFNYWKMLRHQLPELAEKYLATARAVHWPVKIKGNILYQTLSSILGPVNAVKIKYFILKRD